MLRGRRSIFSAQLRRKCRNPAVLIRFVNTIFETPPATHTPSLILDTFPTHTCIAFYCSFFAFSRWRPAPSAAPSAAPSRRGARACLPIGAGTGVNADGSASKRRSPAKPSAHRSAITHWSVRDSVIEAVSEALMALEGDNPKLPGVPWCQRVLHIIFNLQRYIARTLSRLRAPNPRPCALPSLTQARKPH